MSHSAPYFDAVFRFGDVRLSRAELKTAFGVDVFRYEPSRDGEGSYAQVDCGDGSDWNEVAALLRRIGPAIQLALDRQRGARRRVFRS